MAITRESALGVLAFVVAVAFLPDTPGAALTLRWAVSFVGLCAILCWFPTKIAVTPACRVGFVLLAWAALTMLWTPEPLDGAWELLQWELIAAPAFLIGASVLSLKPAYIGLSLGLTISAALAVAQTLGLHPVSPELASPAGLFVNRNALGELAALAVVGCAFSGLWWFVPAPLLALLLTGERVAMLAVLVAGLAWLLRRAKYVGIVALILLLPLGAVYLVAESGRPDSSLGDREAVWLDTVEGLTVFGRGIGSYFTAWPEHHRHFAQTEGRRPDHAHNDALELAFELGLPGLLLALAFAAGCLGNLDGAEGYVVLALLVEGLASFPLHYPWTLLVGLLAAGRAAAAGAAGVGVPTDGRMAPSPWLGSGDEEPAS